MMLFGVNVWCFSIVSKQSTNSAFLEDFTMQNFNLVSWDDENSKLCIYPPLFFAKQKCSLFAIFQFSFTTEVNVLCPVNNKWAMGKFKWNLRADKWNENKIIIKNNETERELLYNLKLSYFHPVDQLILHFFSYYIVSIQNFGRKRNVIKQNAFVHEIR